MQQDDRLRSDARDNRDRILAIARDALADDPKASMHSIAKAAGVGQGTLYRHFPTREALLLGVYRDGIDTLIQLAAELPSRMGPLEALQAWCEQFADFGRKKHGVAEAVRGAMSPKDFDETYWPMVGALRSLMNSCIEAGEIRQPIDAEDFLQYLALLLHLPGNEEGVAREKRLLTLAFRGIGASL